MNTIAGTPYFIAPEVLKGEYGKECDIWSLGVVLFMLLCGDYPFNGNSRPEVFGKIQSGKFDIPSSLRKHATPECIDLIQNMILLDRKKRLTANKCLTHPWFDKVLKQGVQNM